MSSSNPSGVHASAYAGDPAHDGVGRATWYRQGFGARGDWSPTNVVAMAFGFVFFWPLGLVVLAWIASGRHVRDLPGAVRELWARTFGEGGGRLSFGRGVWGVARGPWSDNAVFNDYQQTQLDRIRELEAELAERKRRFAAFRAAARRHADQDEFDRFMAEVQAGAAPDAGPRAAR